MAISVNLYLDTRGIKHAETTNPDTNAKSIECPVRIAITKDSSTSYLATGIKVRPAHWKNRRVIGRPDKMSLNTFLDNYVGRVKSIILDCKEPCKYADKTASEIKNDVSKRLRGSSVESSPSPLFLPYFEEFAGKRRARRTRELYLVSMLKIKDLVPKAELLTLDDITLDWLEDYDEILIELGNKPATRSIEFRNIRAVINNAKKHKLIKDYPFEDFSMPVGESPDRALTKEQMNVLIRTGLEPWEEKYRDFFLLSFYLAGINTEDLLHLKSIEDGRINYIRAKTHKKLSIKVEPEAMTIIDRYRGTKGYLLNMLDTYGNTHNWTSKVNNVLKSISRKCGLPEITMYWARHTWATLAHVDLGIELSTIADAFGHQPEKKVTFTYIKRRGYAKVDEANRKVIDHVI